MSGPWPWFASDTAVILATAYGSWRAHRTEQRRLQAIAEHLRTAHRCCGIFLLDLEQCIRDCGHDGNCERHPDAPWTRCPECGMPGNWRFVDGRRQFEPCWHEGREVIA